MRKKIFTIGLLGTFWTASVQALPVEHFSCTTDIEIHGTREKSTNKQSFFTARLPQSWSPAPDVRITSGVSESETVFQNDDFSITASFGLGYSHATKVDPASNVLEARQHSCLTFGASYCDQGDHSCSSTSETCFQPADPFDPLFGWEVVDLSEDGTPSFEGGFLQPRTVPVSNHEGIEIGTVTLDCQFKGSYQ